MNVHEGQREEKLSEARDKWVKEEGRDLEEIN